MHPVQDPHAKVHHHHHHQLVQRFKGGSRIHDPNPHFKIHHQDPHHPHFKIHIRIRTIHMSRFTVILIISISDDPASDQFKGGSRIQESENPEPAFRDPNPHFKIQHQTRVSAPGLKLRHM